MAGYGPETYGERIVDLYDLWHTGPATGQIERLRAKPGGAELPVTVGDFADVDVEGSFSLVFVVFNTFFALRTQDEQVRCFRNVARRLRPGGRFLIEAFVPDQSRFDRGQRVSVAAIEGDQVRLEVTLHDPVAQRSKSRHLVVGPGGIRSLPVEVRYAFPAELDLMARLAGLALRHRWGGWNEEPFDAGSTSHVSVWERPVAAG